VENATSGAHDTGVTMAMFKRGSLSPPFPCCYAPLNAQGVDVRFKPESECPGKMNVRSECSFELVQN